MIKSRLIVIFVVLVTLTSVVPAIAQNAGNPSPEDMTYVIQPEDTLWDLSRAYDLTLEQLMAANPLLNPYAMPIGTQIIIPVQAADESALNNAAKPQTPDQATPEPTPSPANLTDYVIREGDTLWALTYRFDVSFETLLAANPDVNPQALSIGTVIQVPAQAAPAAQVEPITGTPEAPVNSLPGMLRLMDAPALRENAAFSDALLIEEDPDVPPATFIPPLQDEFSIIDRPITESADLAGETVVDIDETAAPSPVVPQLTPSPALLVSDAFPVTIALGENARVDFAQLSINDTVVATFDEAPFTYDLNVNTLGKGLYLLTFVTENASGVVSSSTLEFEVAPVRVETDAAMDGDLARTGDAPLGIFVNGEQRALDLVFTPETGLQVVQSVMETIQTESLIDILARPTNLIAPEIREAITTPRPELFSIVIIIMTLTLLPQGLFTLFHMMYTWNNPKIAAQYRSPREYFDPQFSFTAIVPARREENVVYDTIRAVDNIDYPDHLKEILVMIRDDDDDATIAAAHRAASDIGKDNVRVITFTEGPKNKPNGLNRGLRASSKDVVCVFDAEDQPHPAIYNVINTVMLRDQADVVQSGVQLVNFKSNWFSALNCLEYFFWFKSGLHAFTRMFQVTPLGGNTVFFKRNWLEKVKGWDDSCLTEDADIGLRLTQAGAKIQIVYDEEHATQEETPDSVEQFVKQRTRWNQGFYQVFLKGDWMRMPTLRQKVTALYILLTSLFQALIVLYLPLGLYIMLTQPLPVPIALISWLPIFMLFTQMIVNLIGLGEFTRAYKQRMPFLFRLKTILVYYPYQLMLSFSAARAIWRLMTNRSSWEKTAHSNLHRQTAAVAQGSV